MADYQNVTILNGDHDPPLPFVIVDRYGMQVDLSKVVGQLWDQKTVANIIWGLRTQSGRKFGVVQLKNGTGRTFSDPELIEPYVKAWKMAKADMELKQAIREAR